VTGAAALAGEHPTDAPGRDPGVPATADGAAARLRHLCVPDWRLESGRRVHVQQAFTLLGQLDADGGNLVVLFHALTGGPDPRTWWPAIVGPGRLLDPARYAILTPNHIGSCYGTTFTPASPAGGEAEVTPRDMARLAWALVDALGVPAVRLAAGGSLGGMVTMEFAVQQPGRVAAAVVAAAPAAHTAHAIGQNHIQRQILALGGDAGLELARMAAMLTYRSPAELERRFARSRRDGRFAVQTYLEHHGRKLRRRFQADAYRQLLDAMDAHDVGRGRGGAAAALRGFRRRLIGVAVTTDQLYPPEDVATWVGSAGGRYRLVASEHGHDAFLLEEEQMGLIIAEALAPEAAV